MFVFTAIIQVSGIRTESEAIFPEDVFPAVSCNPFFLKNVLISNLSRATQSNAPFFQHRQLLMGHEHVNFEFVCIATRDNQPSWKNDGSITNLNSTNFIRLYKVRHPAHTDNNGRSLSMIDKYSMGECSAISLMSREYCLCEFNFGKHIGTFTIYQITSSIGGSISGQFGGIQRLIHNAQLPYKENNLNECCNEHHARERSLPAGIEGKDLIKRRFFIALSAVFFGFLGSLSGGWYAFYNKRVVLGAALIFLGVLLGCSGLFLFWLSRYPSTWGWTL